MIDWTFLLSPTQAGVIIKSGNGIAAVLPDLQPLTPAAAALTDTGEELLMEDFRGESCWLKTILTYFGTLDVAGTGAVRCRTRPQWI